MNLTFSPFASLDDIALADLTNLHMATMHTLLSDLGTAVVQRYYHVACADPNVLGFVAYKDGHLAGWACGSPDPAGLNNRLRQPLPWFLAQMLKLAFTRPAVIIQLARSVLNSDEANLLRPGQVELTYIGVDPSLRGQGLGHALLAEFNTRARQTGYHSVVLSVETDNPAAVALYSHAGFRITRTFQEGRFFRHRMELELN